jgi:hypothetical protein
LTRSHHIYRLRFTSRTTRSQSRDHGVTFFKTCTAEVFRPVSIDENRSFQVIETRKDSAVHVSLSSSSLVKQPGVRKPLSQWLGASQDPHSTANDNRWKSAVDSLILVRSFTGTKTCLGLGPRQRRAQWAVYKPARSALSTVVVNKSSDPRREFCNAENSPHQTFAPYLSHIPATF